MLNKKNVFALILSTLFTITAVAGPLQLLLAPLVYILYRVVRVGDVGLLIIAPFLLWIFFYVLMKAIIDMRHMRFKLGLLTVILSIPYAYFTLRVIGVESSSLPVGMLYAILPWLFVMAVTTALYVLIVKFVKYQRRYVLFLFLCSVFLIVLVFMKNYVVITTECKYRYTRTFEVRDFVSIFVKVKCRADLYNVIMPAGIIN